jgi:hypothetical protein
MKFPRSKHLCPEIKLCTLKGFDLLSIALPLYSIVIQVVVLLSSVLINGAEMYATRMILLLAPLPATDFPNGF